MPAVYVEIIKHALGSAVAHEVTLFGQVYDLDAALRLGVMRKSVSADRLIAEALRMGRIGPSGLLHGLCILEASLASNDDCRNRRGSGA